MKQIPLKNFDADVLVDDIVYEYLIQDPKLAHLDLVNNLRLHSSGCVVFQRTRKNDVGQFETDTIYLHKLIAEHFKSNEKSLTANLAGVKNGNKLDLQLDNVHWRSRATASRQRKTTSSTGFTGVYGDYKRFRAVISHNGKSIHLGMYNTAEEAAEAYNNKSKELFGELGKINAIQQKKV